MSLDLSDPAGKARVADDDGHEVILKRPKWKHLEALRFAQNNLAERERKGILRTRELLAAEHERLTNDDVPADDDEHTASVNAEVGEIARASAEAVAGWWSRAFELLAEDTSNWPVDDWQEWPGWMLEGAGIINTLVAYWRTVPLDRGAMGRQVAENPSAPA